MTSFMKIYALFLITWSSCWLVVSITLSWGIVSIIIQSIGVIVGFGMLMLALVLGDN